MAGITESCSVCGGEFLVQFRYQMEERDGGFLFFCSQKCLETSQVAGSGADKGAATCDACAKRFTPDLVSQVLYVAGRRHYACSLGCRAQVLSEAKGARLGDIMAAPSVPPPAAAAEGPGPSRRRPPSPPVLQARAAPASRPPAARPRRPPPRRRPPRAPSPSR